MRLVAFVLYQSAICCGVETGVRTSLAVTEKLWTLPSESVWAFMSAVKVALSKSPALAGALPGCCDWVRPVSWSKRDGPLLEFVFGAVFLPVGSFAAWT